MEIAEYLIHLASSQQLQQPPHIIIILWVSDEKCISVCLQAAYSENLPHYGFYFFLKLKLRFKDYHFLTLDSVQNAVTDVMKPLTVADFQSWGCTKCVALEECYFERGSVGLDKLLTKWFCTKLILRHFKHTSYIHEQKPALDEGTWAWRSWLWFWVYSSSKYYKIWNMVLMMYKPVSGYICKVMMYDACISKRNLQQFLLLCGIIWGWAFKLHTGRLVANPVRWWVCTLFLHAVQILIPN